ncbi:hypothetical protein BJ741DRAFT_587062 [Chytriomyces cf. hyalinus JEL632]|nr:hypothetical protein BJ741DRAFT_587062 [Chytriomyces cf. hyalinus JEL632]
MASSSEQFQMGSVQSVVVLSVTGILCVGVVVFIAVRIRALVLEAKGEKVPKWVDQPSSLVCPQPMQDSEIPSSDLAYMSRKRSGSGGVADSSTTRAMNTDSGPSPQSDAHHSAVHPLHVVAPAPAMPSTYFPPHAQYPHPQQQQHQQAYTSDASKNVSLVGTVNTIYSHSSKRQSTLVNVVYSHEPEKPILPTANTNNFFWMPSFAQKATTSTKHAFYTSSTTPKDAPLHSKKSRSNSLSSSFCESRSSIGGLDDAEVKEWPSSPPLDSYINSHQNLVQKTHHADGGTAAKTLVDAFQTSSANRPKKPSFMEYFGFLAGKESVASSDSENGVLTTEDSEDLKFSSGPIMSPTTTITTPTTTPITPVTTLPSFATLPLPPSLKTETTMRKSHSMSTEAAYLNRRTEILRRKQVSASVKDSSSWNAATLAILGQPQQQQHAVVGTDEWSDALSDNEMSLSSDSTRKAVGIAAMRSDDSLGKYLY